MKCCEAQESFGLMWDVPSEDPKRRMLEQHIATCTECSAEFEFWEESQCLIHGLSVDVTELQSESVNRQVMDRIYSESPWLIQDKSQPFAVSGATRRKLSLWITACLMLFCISFFYLVMMDRSDPPIDTAPMNGILPTGVAGIPNVFPQDGNYIIPALNSGIIEPLVVTMGPTHPIYWMVLSTLSVALALYSLRRLGRIRR